MARYFFHLRDGERLLAVDDGEELRILGLYAATPSIVHDSF